MPSFERALESSRLELAQLRRQLLDRHNWYHGCLRRTHEAIAALPSERTQLQLAVERRGKLQKGFKQAQIDRVERERIAAENASSCGCG